MAPSSSPAENGASKGNAGAKLQFIFVQTPEDIKDRTSRRAARSHAVTQALENKRKLQQKSGLNFRPVFIGDGCPSRIPRKPKQQPAVACLLWPPDVNDVDAFKMLATDLPRLRNLLIFYGKMPSLGPAFDVSDELVLQNINRVLRNEREDYALLYAIRLTFASAATTGYTDKKRLEYKGETLSSLRQNMSSPDTAASEPTLGAILLLAGAEARWGMPSQVQLHMSAIQGLLDTCRRRGVLLSDGIKRAIFWQDLNSSVMTGSTRVFDHTTFSELRWTRDHSTPDAFILPSGFRDSSGLLGHDLVEILEDVHALQCIRDTHLVERQVMSMTNLDNHQASVQSRLHSLSACSSISDCCRLGAYLCSTTLRCKLWHDSTVPPHLSLHLLRRLQDTNDDPVWDEQWEMLTWLLYIGGSFAPSGTLRSTYMELLQLNHNGRLKGLYSSWSELLAVLKRFIWSENAFFSQVLAFWGEVSSQNE